MAFTRFNYDDCRTKKKLQESTGPGRYSLNMPGNGPTPCFFNDPQIRMQKFGANLSHNLVDINSSLLGLNEILSRDQIKANNGRSGNSEPFNDTFSKMYFPSFEKAVTDESRMMMPAWALRDQEQVNWQYLHYNPQIKAEMNFENNLSSRILEKNNFHSNIHC